MKHKINLIAYVLVEKAYKKKMAAVSTNINEINRFYVGKHGF